MPPRPSTDRDSGVHYEPLRASVLDVFEQLGAFDDQSGIVEWIFPEFHAEKEVQRSRVKLTEVFDAPEPEPETPRKSRASRFFRLGTKARSKSRSKKDAPPPPPVSPPSKQKAKKSRSSPDLRKKAAESGPPGSPPISLPIKQAPTVPAEQKSPEHKSPEHKARRLSLFPRKPAQSLDQPRPSISDEEWQQITMTGSIADYETNPFLGMDPHGNNDAGPVKRDGLQKHLSRFTSSFTRSTPTSPTREQHAPSPLSGSALASPTREHSASSLSGRRPEDPPSDPASLEATSDPTTPTGLSSPPMPTSPAIMSQSNESTSTLTAAPASASPEIQEVQREDALETTSQIDHIRNSLSDISEGDASESSTLSMNPSRNSQASTQDTSVQEEAS